MKGEVRGPQGGTVLSPWEGTLQSCDAAPAKAQVGGRESRLPGSSTYTRGPFQPDLLGATCPEGERQLASPHRELRPLSFSGDSESLRAIWSLPQRCHCHPVDLVDSVIPQIHPSNAPRDFKSLEILGSPNKVLRLLQLVFCHPPLDKRHWNL